MYALKSFVSLIKIGKEQVKDTKEIFWHALDQVCSVYRLTMPFTESNPKQHWRINKLRLSVSIGTFLPNYDVTNRKF